MKNTNLKFGWLFFVLCFLTPVVASCLGYMTVKEYGFLHDMNLTSITNLLEQTMAEMGYQVVERDETTAVVRGKKTSDGTKYLLSAWLGKSGDHVFAAGDIWKDVGFFLDNINAVAKKTLFASEATHYGNIAGQKDSYPSEKKSTGDKRNLSEATVSLPTHYQLEGWAVIIGISKYQYAGRHNLTNLIFADDDARAFARVLRNLGWSESHMKLLLNEEATQRNIMIALESWLTKAGPDDQIVLFWAGHGFPDPEDPEKVYLTCYDTNLLIPATGYRMDRVIVALEERSARNVVIFADTCHAGKLITRGQRGISIMPKIDQMRRENKIPKGWIWMVGAETDRKAIEHSSWANGAFTHCLLSALSGKADGYMSSGVSDGVVTMGELRTYMNTVMPDETQRVLGVVKRPVITTSTGDPEIWNLSLHAR